MVSVTVGGVGNAPRGRSKVKGSWTLGKSVSVSLNLSWFGYQGPRGLPGERGRPGPPGAAVSIPGPWVPLGSGWGSPQGLLELDIIGFSLSLSGCSW